MDEFFIKIFVFVVVFAGAPVFAEESGWSVYWKNGTRIESEDSRFKLKLGGRIQADFNVLSADGELEDRFGPFADGNEFRRARLFVSGTLYGNVEFKAQYDFAGGDAELKDAYLGLTGLAAVGGVRVGHFKEPFGLAELTSSKYLAFLERPLPSEAFAPSRNFGLMLHNNVLDERLRWSVGLFRDSDGFGAGTGDGGFSLTGRLAGTPVYRGEGRRVLHLAVAASRRSPQDERARLRSRPEAHLAPRLVATPSLVTDRVDLLGLEAALVQGPFWLQGEWMEARVDADLVGDPGFTGSYLEAGFFLTGENRNYLTAEAAFGRLTPRQNLGPRGGGAWEIAVRYSTLDLRDAGVAGGEEDNLGVALNGYLNPATRVMLDYVEADLKGGGEGDFVLLRFQVDF